MPNLNEVAKEITKVEGLKNSVNIGDVKEILGHVFRTYSLEDIVRIWLRYNRERR